VFIFYDHLEYFIAIWYNLRSFGLFFFILVCLDQEKSGNPGLYVEYLSTTFVIIRYVTGYGCRDRET
jgi:hypothetical protein